MVMPFSSNLYPFTCRVSPHSHSFFSCALSPAFKKQFALTISIKWLSSVKPSPDELLPPLKPTVSLLSSTLRPPRHILKSPQPSVLSPCPVHPPCIPPGFSRAVGGPVTPQCSSTSQETLVSTAFSSSPVMILHKVCELTCVGLPHYELYYSHAGPDGFLYFTYKVFIPGISPAFKGMVMILPGATATNTLEDARQAAAQLVLQSVYKRQLSY